MAAIKITLFFILAISLSSCGFNLKKYNNNSNNKTSLNIVLAKNLNLIDSNFLFNWLKNKFIINSKAEHNLNINSLQFNSYDLSSSLSGGTNSKIISLSINLTLTKNNSLIKKKIAKSKTTKQDKSDILITKTISISSIIRQDNFESLGSKEYEQTTRENQINQAASQIYNLILKTIHP